MPKTSVSPAASKNNSSPNCRPFRHCSINSSMGFGRRTTGGRFQPLFFCLLILLSFSPLPSAFARPPSPLHRALVVELILAVLDDRGNGAEGEIALRVLHHGLQIDTLDREVVVAVLVVTPE